MEVAEVADRSANISKLSELVRRWGDNKVVFDPLKKEVEKDAAEIKRLMLNEEFDTVDSGNYTACLTFKTSESFDEEGMMQYIKEHIATGKSCPYIKKVEVLDWDALEKAIYNGKISKEQVLELDKFKSVKKTPVLNFAKAKKEE